MLSNIDMSYILELSVVSNVSNKSKRDRLVEKVAKKYNKNISSKTLNLIDKKNNINYIVNKYQKDMDYDI